MLQRKEFNKKYFSYFIDGEPLGPPLDPIESTKPKGPIGQTETVKSKIFILVSFTDITKWKKELELWNFSVYTISKSSTIKKISEISESVILIAETQQKNLKIDNFFDVPYQLYVFIDDKIHKIFKEIVSMYCKSEIFISDDPKDGSKDGSKDNPEYDHHDIIQIEITQETVDEQNGILPIITKNHKFGLPKIFKDLQKELLYYDQNFINYNECCKLFSKYNLSESDGIDKLIEKIIIDQEGYIKINSTNKDVIINNNNIRKSIDNIKKIMSLYKSKCSRCETLITSGGNNCMKCFEYYCDSCLDVKKDHKDDNNDHYVDLSCPGCILINEENDKDNPSSISKYIKNILNTCDQRKILFYSSYHNDDDELFFKDVRNLKTFFYKYSYNDSHRDTFLRFNEEKGNVILASSSYYNLNINFKELTDIIIRENCNTPDFNKNLLRKCQTIDRRFNLNLHVISTI